MPKITFITTDYQRITVDAKNGLSIMEVATEQDLAMPAACGGSCACATCHVVIEEGWYNRLLPPTDEEEDLLDSAQDLTNTSRLSCQIPLTEVLDGIVVSLTPVYD